MPLIKGKSKQAFSHNVGAEMNAGKPQKQALAIAYAMKRKAQHKAMGGMIDDEAIDHSEPMEGDTDQFLSAEEGLESPFQDQKIMSDEQELAEMDNQAKDSAPDYNEHGDSDQDEARASMRAIMQRVRMKHMGR